MNDDTFVPRRSAPPLSAVLGIVVPLPEPLAQLLVDWRAKVGDPQASLVPPHVTLLPPTEVEVAARTVAEVYERVGFLAPAAGLGTPGTGP